jgi:hypothetical protein
MTQKRSSSTNNEELGPGIRLNTQIQQDKSTNECAQCWKKHRSQPNTTQPSGELLSIIPLYFRRFRGLRQKDHTTKFSTCSSVPEGCVISGF